MYVKIYEYHIKKEYEATFFEVQKQVSRIYKKYVSCNIKYLQSVHDATLWMEISEFNREEEYLQGMEQVNKDPLIQELFKLFETCLVTDKQEIKESSFIIRLKM